MTDRRFRILVWLAPALCGAFIYAVGTVTLCFTRMPNAGDAQDAGLWLLWGGIAVIAIELVVAANAAPEARERRQRGPRGFDVMPAEPVKPVEPAEILDPRD